MTRCLKVNQRIKPTLDVVDAAWSSVLSTLRFARLHSKEEQLLQRQLDVTLLTGFLGSGKTTVLRHLLEHPGDLKIAVIVNDVGAIEVDAHLIRDMTSQQISLSNGCVCCALSNDLSDQLQQLSADLYDVVLIEASGVADPVNISQVIHGLPECRLDGIVAVADPTSLDTYLDNPQIASLLSRQLQTAHLVLLSKSDLTDEAQQHRAIDLISAIAPGSRIISIRKGEIDLGLVVGAAINGVSMPSNEEIDAFPFASTVVSPAGPWHPTDVGRLLDKADHQLLRGKGWFADGKKNLYQLQIVGRRWSIDGWRNDAPCAVVLIGAHEGNVAAAETMFRSLDQL